MWWPASFDHSMSEHSVIIRWSHPSPDFCAGRYSREHTWSFDGGLTVPASPSPLVVPAPWSNAAHLDPEEAYVASVSSCHMLTFLWVASRAGFAVTSYEDQAVGVMTRNEAGIPWVSRITLRVAITYEDARRPSPEAEEGLHHQAHEQCFIANSVKTEIVVENLSSEIG
jgi:organic hydroperoxide reductase OsmC/OhrA